jgi:hypothetical protein
MLTYVHYGETFCCWQFESKGGVVAILEKLKEEEKGGPDPVASDRT